MRRAAILLLLFACERAEDAKPNPDPPPVPVRIPVEPNPAAKGFLGIRYIKAPYGGVRIEEVIPSTPAEAAGLAYGDIILRYEDRELVGVELADRVEVTKPGHIARLHVERNGQPLTVLVQVGAWPELMARDEPAPQSPP